MFETFSDCRDILVTGPHRSGTRICAKMIAEDTGKRFVDEIAFSHRYVRDIPEFFGNSVIQSPWALSWLPWFCKFSDLTIVVMIRDQDEVIRSQENSINPRGLKVSRAIASPYMCYELWESYKASGIIPEYQYHEVLYESLESHKLWVPKDQRRQNKNWTHTSTKESK